MSSSFLSFFLFGFLSSIHKNSYSGSPLLGLDLFFISGLFFGAAQLSFDDSLFCFGGHLTVWLLNSTFFGTCLLGFYGMTLMGFWDCLNLNKSISLRLPSRPISLWVYNWTVSSTGLSASFWEPCDSMTSNIAHLSNASSSTLIWISVGALSKMLNFMRSQGVFLHPTQMRPSYLLSIHSA